MRRSLPAGLILLLFGLPLQAEDSPELDSEAVRASTARGLKIVETGARNYPNHRECFSCHHQTLPLLAMQSAREAGVEIDEELFGEIIDFSRRSFEGRLESLRNGTGIGGRSMTVAYGLWTLEIAGAEPDELSSAMVTYLLKNQQENGAWRPPSNRPPLEESVVMCTVLAIYGVETLAGEAQRDAAAAAIKTAANWLDSAKLSSQEDYNARLWGMARAGVSGPELQKAVRTVIARQRDDGGWGQTAEMPSDAYATGQTLFLLLESGRTHDSPEIRKGLAFLLNSQGEGGSWHVATRSKPVQVYFDNGDPHGKDQFISMSATSWAVAALSRGLTGENDRATPGTSVSPEAKSETSAAPP